MRTVELAIRTAMLRLGGSLLEDLLAADNGHRGTRVECDAGHQAEFVDYREKGVDTVLGAIRLKRAYYQCRECAAGVVPRDRELGVEASSLSPGLLRMVARVGSQAPFSQGRDDLAELAGIKITAKRIERSAEASGAAVKMAIEEAAAAIVSGEVTPLPEAASVSKLYVTVDGTGVPMVPKATEGRRGKGPDGRARTREAKVGCVFTQTKLDAEGHPVRDPDSSTYAATLEAVPRFGDLVYAEARRRGLEQAAEVIVIGDGAPWIWNLADEHFPSAVQIVDLYHAREHLHGLARQVSPPDLPDGRSWVAARLAELDRGDIEELVLALRETAAADASGELRTAIGYFDNNRERMRYGCFRQRGFFVGSGTVEAGCKSVIHQRLKQSGMRWSASGAASIMALRCEQKSGRWESIWTRRRSQTSVA